MTTLQTDGLMEILKEQEQVMDELLAIGEEQQSALKEDDYETLYNITSRQEAKGREFALLERKRQELLAEMSVELGFTIERLQDIYPNVASDEDEGRLKEIASRMAEKHDKLVEIHQMNTLLLKQGLSLASRILSSIDGRRENTVYGRSGNIERRNHKGFINKSV